MDSTQLALLRGSSIGEVRELRASAAALAITLLTLNVIDLVVTNLNIMHFGATELNLLVAPLLGTPWAVIATVGIPLAIVVLGMGVRSVQELRAIQVAVGIYMVVVLLGVGQALFAVV